MPLNMPETGIRVKPSYAFDGFPLGVLMNLMPYTKGHGHTTPGEAADALPGKHPEVATTPYWIDLVVKARKAKGWNQTELGRRVGVGQPTISKLETGESKTSALVHPICDVLKIQLPYALINDDLERRWIEVGRELRSLKGGERIFESRVKGAEDLLEAMTPRSPNEPPQH
jgi:transcriptional regulator with XRE-family HTH domain